MESYNKPAGIMAVGLIVAAIIVSLVFYKIRAADDSITVTGSAKQRISADTVTWTGGFSRIVPFDNLKSGYSQMKADENQIRAFLKTNKVTDVNVTISPIVVDAPYTYDKNAIKEYNLRQTVTVRSTDVSGIAKLANSILPLIDAGIIFSTQMIDYSYSKLPALRVSMLSEAVRDAQARADKIVEPSGNKVGALKSASVGVVQVLAPNSNDVVDYGSYDTTSIEKDVMVTVKVVFRLK